MNAAEYRTMCDLAYTKAIEMELSAEHAGREGIALAWNAFIHTIMEECIDQFGEFPSLVD